MAQILMPENTNSVYLFTPCSGIKSSKRKVEQVDTEDFFDGIKRLYNDDCSDGNSSSSVGMVTCGSEARSESSSLPPLQTVAN